MTKVVKEVIAEVRGKSDQFTAEMAKVEGRAKQAKAGIEGVGAGSQQMGQRVAEASRQIASATETIARSGKITGEAGKQIASQAANIAFAFGPQGAAIGAVAIFGIALSTMLTRAKREAAEAAESFNDSLQKMMQARDQQGLIAQASKLYRGTADYRDPSGMLAPYGDPNSIRERQRRIASLEQGLTIGDTKRLAEIARERAALQPLLDQYNALRAAILDPAPPEQLARGVLGAVTINADAPGKKNPGIAAARADLADFEKAAADAATRTDRLIRDTMATSVDAIAQPFDELIAQLDQLLVEGADVDANMGRVAALEALRDQAVAAAEALARAESVLSGLDTAAATGVEPTVDSFIALNAEISALEGQLQGLRAGTKVFEQVSAKLLELQKRRQDLGKDVANAGSAKGIGKTEVRDVADYARELQQAADGALQLAAAFGLVNESSTKVLRSIGQIAGSIPALAKALQSGGGLGILSAALPIAGALASLVGTDPADAARRKALEDNTAAIRELTAKSGLLGLGVSGAQASGASAGLRGFLRGYQPGIGQVVAGGESYSAQSQARVAAQAFGLNVRELERLAAQYGITLNGNIRSFEQLAEAIESTITKLGEFGTDLDSQLTQADAAAKIFGITDPLAKLGLTQGAYGGRSPILDQALAGLDLSTAEGREAARTALQGIFTTLQAGGGTLSAADLGGLTGDQLLQAILDLIAGLNDVDESLGLNTSTVGQPDREITADRTQITADQASRLLGVTTTMASDVRVIRDAIVAASAGLPVPALAAGFSSAGSAGTTVYITQEFHGLTGGARDVARQVHAATLEAIDQGLGRRVLIRERHAGKAVTS